MVKKINLEEVKMKTVRLTPENDLNKEINALTGPAEVILSKGIYRQKTKIRANGVTIIGESRDETVITYDDYARKIHADGQEYNTFRTYTLCVTGEGVTLKNLTVENSNTNPRERGQCVALSVNAGNFYAENVNLISTQDTLFLYPFPDDLVTRYSGFIPQDELYREGGSLHLFENCRISGTVDFIFGCAEAYFRRCEIVSAYDDRHVGFVAAPAHSLKQERGFCFSECAFVNGGADCGSVFLARPWRDYGKCIFLNCRAEGHISPLLFDKWNDTGRDKTARFGYYGLDCAFTPAPVEWGRELSGDEARLIINNVDAHFTANKR